MNESSLTFIIDRFEDKFAVLRGDDGYEINWPKKQLPKGAKEGSAVVLKVVLEEEDAAERRKTAKELLKEILNG
jgi:hypothetical protein